MTRVEDGGGVGTHEVPRRKISTPLGVTDLESIEENADALEFQRKISVSSRDGPPHRKVSTGMKHDHRLYSLHSLELEPSGQSQNINVAYLRECAAKSDQSWWYLLCLKCRQNEPGAGWEPRAWQKVCPYPYCSTYRCIARCLSLALTVMVVWGVVYSVVGEDAAPGGQLFQIAVLFLTAHVCGALFRMCYLPGLVAMIFVGMTFQNLKLIRIQGQYQYACAVLTKIALTIILTRAGLDLEPKAMKSLTWTILKLSLVPWLVEAGIILILTHYLMGLPWMWSLLTGAIIAAVAPAVVVSALMRLRQQGYGVAKGIPTLVIAVSGMDDATSVAAFGIIQSLMFSKNPLLYDILLGPVCIFGGIGYGIVWGLLSQFLPEKGDPFVVPLRIVMLLGGGLLALFGSESIGVEGAGPLGVVAAGFVAMTLWCKQGWDIENVRVLSTVLVAFGSILNLKERLFVALSCIAKASVQAALAPVALCTVVRLGRGDTPDHQHAQLMVVICVISVVLTAPIGAITIFLAGPRLLTKTVPSPSPPSSTKERSVRPSLRGITVVDDGSETHDIRRRQSYFERRKSSSTASSPRTQMAR